MIPSLSLGLSLSSPYLPPDELDSFMRRMLVSRISRRVLAEHHIALSEIHAGRRSHNEAEPHVGIIFTCLHVKRSIEKCAQLLRERPFGIEDHYGESTNESWPEVVVDGHIETEFAYIREHLEYVVIRFLSSAFSHSLLRFWQIYRFRALEECMHTFSCPLTLIVLTCLKSMRATGLHHQDKTPLPPIRATIVAGVKNVGIRISDQGK